MIEKVVMKKTIQQKPRIRLSDEAVVALIEMVDSQSDLYLREIQENLWTHQQQWKSW